MPNIPIEIAEDKEATTCWSDFRSPASFMRSFVGLMSVDTDKLGDKEGVVFSPNQPAAADNAKIWVKNSKPYGLGIFVGEDEYVVFYEYPVDTPFILKQGVDLIEGMRQLSGAEISGYGFSSPTNGSSWVIFEPSLA